MNEERCIMCGAVIPEGRQVCGACWDKVMKEETRAKQYKITIFGNPASKKNSQVVAWNNKTHRPFISQSDRYKRWAKEVTKQLNLWSDRPELPFNVPVRLTYLFYKDSKRLCDDLNLSAAMDDILVQAGVIVDDNRDCVSDHDGTRVYYDRENPRVEITITEVKGWERWKK